MKAPHLLKIIPPINASFIIKGDEIAWNNPWHYHPELELIFCIKGKGTNFVGNAITSIEDGEILLFGSNLPHTRQRDKSYYESNQQEKPESIVVQFRSDFLGDSFFDILEFLHIKELMNRSLRGLKFYGKTLTSVSSQLYTMRSMGGTQRILAFLAILDELARSDEYIFLNSPSYIVNAHEKYAQRINAVYEYTVANFRNPIELSEVAALTHLSVSAFCRYFRKITRKSYMEYLTEIRISYACKLLSEQKFDVTQIAYKSGFNSISNFNKLFKRLMKSTPKQYQKNSAVIN